MTRKGAFLRPGTILLFVFIALFGFGMYNWATTNLSDTRESSLEDQNNAIACSGLEIYEQGIQTSEDRVTLFFEVNRDVERVDLNFEGEKNITRTVRLVQKGRIQSSTVNMSNFSSVSLKTRECSRVFQFE